MYIWLYMYCLYIYIYFPDAPCMEYWPTFSLIPYMEHLGTYIYIQVLCIYSIIYLYTYIVKGKSWLNNQDFIQMEHPRIYAPKPIPLFRRNRTIDGVTCCCVWFLYIFTYLYVHHVPVITHPYLSRYQTTSFSNLDSQVSMVVSGSPKRW